MNTKRNVVGEIIAIGDEITCGKRLDTNSQWLSQRLSELGVDVRFHTTIGDRLEDYRVAFETASRRANLVVCSGGLGPTEDDLTSQALAELVGVPLEFDSDSWKHIESIFAKRNRPIAPSNRKQALRPQGSRAIFNPNGTAPGIDLTLPKPDDRSARVFAFPGVPAELHEMWPSIATEIRKLVGERVFYHFTLNCFGAGESDTEAMIPAEIMRRSRDPLVGITASHATISLRISTIGESVEQCRQFVQPTIDKLRAALGDLIYGEQDEPLASVVLRSLKRMSRTIAIADLGLDGRLFQDLKQFDPSSDIVLGGLQLGEKAVAKIFPEITSTDFDDEKSLLTVSSQVRRLFGSDIGLAIGPFPPPNLASQLFRIGLTDGTTSWSFEFPCAGHPAVRALRATKQILNFLRLNVVP